MIVSAHGGCAAIVRTLHFHQRTIPEAAARYGAEVWARGTRPGVPAHAFDREVGHGDRLPGGVQAFTTARDDELVLWLPRQRALVCGDVMLRNAEGELSLCPESWVQRAGGYGPLRESLAPLPDLGPEHVLVSHGPLVLGDGATALPRALAD